MTGSTCGLLSELVLVRVHGRADEYLRAPEEERPAIVAACRREATVPDLAERILARTIYAQASTRSAPLRELIQNALDASPRGARIEVRLSDDGRELTVSDQGPGMTRTELLEDLLVPFRSAKEGEPATIGEHGIGFFSALEIAPWVEVISVTRAGGHRLRISPVGEGPPYPNFSWAVAPITRRSWHGLRGSTGTSVRLLLGAPTTRAAVATELTAAVGLVDPVDARIYLNGTLVNTSRSRLRRVARAPIALGLGARPSSLTHGDLVLYLGRGEGIEPQLTFVQKGLTVSSRMDPFLGLELGLHRDLARAITAAGFGLIAELPLSVPLNKGRSAVAASASAAVEAALVAAFERFMLGDALYDRELLRAVDHRLSSVLDRLIAAAMLGEAAPPPAPPAATDGSQPRAPTVAAPEEVVRFASGLLDAPLFTAVGYDATLLASRHPATLRQLLDAQRAGVLRPLDGRPPAPGLIHLPLDEPLAQALWRRLSAVAAPPPPDSGPRLAPTPMARTPRDVLLARAGHLPGVRSVAAAMGVLERIDTAIAQAAELEPSPIWVHQDLYGPDEMAHTDGSGISVNLASPRVRALLAAALSTDDPAALSALIDLMLHEKAHVSLASYVPRPQAEHGTSFYRRKEWLRRRLLYAIDTGVVADPMRWLLVARRGLDGGVLLPSTESLALALAEPAPGHAEAA